MSPNPRADSVMTATLYLSVFSICRIDNNNVTFQHCSNDKMILMHGNHLDTFEH